MEVRPKSALSRLVNGLKREQHDYRVSLDVFPALNIDKLARDLELAKAGAERGAREEPASDTLALDDIESAVIERKGDSILTYQRVSPKIVSDRDYTLRIQKKSWPVQNGLAYLNRWEPANERGPAARPGVFRVTVCEGSWLLEPTGEAKTRATYSVFTDSGIVGPAFIANTISTTGISKLFAAVRKQVKDPKYQSK